MFIRRWNGPIQICVSCSTKTIFSERFWDLLFVLWVASLQTVSMFGLNFYTLWSTCSAKMRYFAIFPILEYTRLFDLASLPRHVKRCLCCDWHKVGLSSGSAKPQLGIWGNVLRSIAMNLSAWLQWPKTWLLCTIRDAALPKSSKPPCFRFCFLQPRGAASVFRWHIFMFSSHVRNADWGAWTERRIMVRRFWRRKNGGKMKP